MNLVRCEKGHYYDSDKHTECPHCDDKAEHFKNALAAVKEKRFDEAKAELLRVVEFAKKVEGADFVLVSSGNEVMYAFLEKHFEPKKIIEVELNYSMAYCLLGEIEVENGRLPQARDYLDLSLEWNPYNGEAIFEKAETYKITGDLENFYKLTTDSYERLFFPAHMARFYRNLGFYYIEKEKYFMALALFLHSLSFEKSDMAINEIAYIKQKSNIQSFPEPEVTNKLLQENNIPISVCDKNLAIFKALNESKKRVNYCPSCGTKQSAGVSEYCPKCGKAFALEEGETLRVCECCNHSNAFGDKYCRGCGVNWKIIYSDEKSFTEEAEVCEALLTLEKLMRLHFENDKNDFVLGKLLNLLHKVPLYVPVDIDIAAMLGDKDPLSLKKGDIIQPERDVRIKVLTANIKDLVIIPLFTSNEKMGENHSTSVTRLYPEDYLPILTKMNLHAVINLFDDERFILSEGYLKSMLDNISFNKAKQEVTINCPNCKTELPNDARFCAKCGTEILKTCTLTDEEKGDPKSESLEGLVVNDRYQSAEELKADLLNVDKLPPKKSFFNKIFK